VGSQLFTAAGPDVVRALVQRGERVFLDLKFHDIPQTVAAAGVEAVRLGVALFTVHASGGPTMMKTVRDAVREASVKESLAQPQILAVTVLTSLRSRDLERMRMSGPVQEQVLHLAALALKCGLDGVVASPLEIEPIKGTVPRCLVVTPGVRPAGFPRGDQERLLSPGEAVRRGADYVVVGRPILEAPDPVQAAEAILKEMQT
jgi:orotidine-5'-phosphate decarboxylase